VQDLLVSGRQSRQSPLNIRIPDKESLLPWNTGGFRIPGKARYAFPLPYQGGTPHEDVLLSESADRFEPSGVDKKLSKS